MKVPLFKPYLGKEEIDALREVFETGWVGLGPKTVAFEEMFAKYIGTKIAIGVNSGTSALDLALKILDLEPGEVLVPTITFAATAHVVEYNPQLRVRFTDVDDTLCMDLDDLQTKLTAQTRAVIPVHVGGQACQMDKLIEIVHNYNPDIKVIEDCANCTGGSYKIRKLGSWGDFGCFSFESKKNMTTGDGGMITTDHTHLKDKLKRMRWFGVNKDTWARFSTGNGYSWYYEISDIGYKYNMNDIMAAIGIEQLKKLDQMNKAKNDVIRRYNEELESVDWLEIPSYYDLNDGAYWLYIIRVDDRDNLMDYLMQNDITTGVHFMPVHLHPYYQKKYVTELPKAEKIWKRIISLPLYYKMPDQAIEKVISTIKAFKG